MNYKLEQKKRGGVVSMKVKIRMDDLVCDLTCSVYILVNCLVVMVTL